jgi:hypothetical protein
VADDASLSKQPPAPPQFKPKFQIYGYQYIAIPILILVPLLAVFGVFGTTYASVESAGERARLRVDYPERVFTGESNEMAIHIRHVGTGDMTGIELWIDQSYLEQFTDVRFTPDITTLTDEYAIIALENLAQSETRLVTIELAGHAVGSHEAEIRLRADGTEEATVRFSTLVFP